MADIAKNAGMSPAAVHYYFKTKQEILVRALLWANQSSSSWLESETPDASPLERLRLLLQRSIPYSGTQRDEYLIEIDLWSSVRLHPELLPGWESYHQQWIDGVTEILRAGAEAHAFCLREPARDVAERIVALTDGLSAQSAVGARSMPPERVQAIVTAFVAEQLGLDRSVLDQPAAPTLEHGDPLFDSAEDE